VTTEIFLRNSTLADVDAKLRLIDLIAVPWDEEADVFWRNEWWHESFERGSFDGIEAHAGRVRVNREHVIGDTVGKVVAFEPSHKVGLWTRTKIAATPRGDETLALAAEDMISASVGYRIENASDVEVNKRTKTRKVLRAFLDHLGMVEAPAYPGAEVLAVRAEQSGLAVVETSLPATPALDEAMNDPLLAWVRQRLAAK
jgi:HK97 family phage prohead protease